MYAVLSPLPSLIDLINGWSVFVIVLRSTKIVVIVVKTQNIIVMIITSSLSHLGKGSAPD